MSFYKQEKDSVSFLRDRVRRLYPHYLFSFAMFFLIINFVVLSINPQRILNNFIESIWEVMLMPMTGIGEFKYLGIAWYVSSLLIATYILHQLLMKNEKFSLTFIIPVMVVVIYGYMYQNDGGIGSWKLYRTFVRNGLLRAFAGMGVGIICYLLVQKIKMWRPSPIFRGIFTVLEFSLYLIVLVNAYAGGYAEKCFLLILCMFFGFCITFGNISYSGRIFHNRVIAYLGNLSYAIYLNHWLIMRLFAFRFAEDRAPLIPILYFSVVMVYSMITMKVVSFITGHFHKKLVPKIRTSVIGWALNEK